MAQRTSRREAFMKGMDEFDNMPALIMNSTGSSIPTSALKSAMPPLESSSSQSDGNNNSIGPGGDGSLTIEPDHRGLFKLSMKSPADNLAPESVRAVFSQHGEVKDVFLSGGLFYISFGDEESAKKALLATKEEYGVRPVTPRKRNPSDLYTIPNHGGQDIFITNLSPNLTVEELESYLSDFKPLRVNVHQQSDTHSYAFAKFVNADLARRAIYGLCNVAIGNRVPNLRLVRDKSKTRILEEGTNKPNRNGTLGRWVVPDPMMLHVGNIPVAASNEEIASLFSDLGGMSKCMVKLTKDTQRKYAKVTLRSAALAENAVKDLNNTLFLGNNITVSLSRVPDTTYSGPAPTHNGGGQHGHSGHHSGRGGSGSRGVDPILKAYSLAKKINVLSTEVLDQCDICQRMQALIVQLERSLAEAI